MKKVGLVFNIIGVAILGFQPLELWVSAGIKPKHNFLNVLGWSFLGLGFLLQLIAKEK